MILFLINGLSEDSTPVYISVISSPNKKTHINVKDTLEGDMNNFITQIIHDPSGPSQAKL